jgi:hypothetical protein
MQVHVAVNEKEGDAEQEKKDKELVAKKFSQKFFHPLRFDAECVWWFKVTEFKGVYFKRHGF